MQLTKEQQAILDGSRGETMSRVMQTLVAYGEAFDAQRMVPVTSEYGHTVISFGLGIMKPVYELYDKILSDGAVSPSPRIPDPSTSKTSRRIFCRRSSLTSCTASRRDTKSR